MYTEAPKDLPSPYSEHAPAALLSGEWAWMAAGEGPEVIPVELGKQLDPKFGTDGVAAVKFPTREAAIEALHTAIGAAEADRR